MRLSKTFCERRISVRGVACSCCCVMASFHNACRPGYRKQQVVPATGIIHRIQPVFFLLLRIVLHWYSFFHDQLLKMPTIREVRNLAPALVLVLACVWPLVREIDVVRDLDAVEFHCGQKAITKAITSAGLQCLGLDILQGPEQDICSDLGLAAHANQGTWALVDGPRVHHVRLGRQSADWAHGHFPWR